MKPSISLRSLSFFFLPLALTSFLTIVTHSLFNAGMARLPSPEVMIAAFAVAKSLMMLLHSPTTMIKQSATALIDHSRNLKRPVVFMALVVLGSVFLLAVLAFTGLSRFVFREFMGLSGQTLDEAVAMLRILFIFPGIVAFRDFFQAMSIKFRKTPAVTVAAILRIGFVMLFISFIGRMTTVAPAALAALMFIGAVVVESLVIVAGTYLLNGRLGHALDRMKRTNGSPVTVLTYGNIARFYIPLMVTTLIRTVVMPIINGGLARTDEPDLAISVFAVAWSLGLVVLSPFIMFHQVPLNFCDVPGRYNNRNVRRFGLILAVISATAMLLLGFTDLGYWVLTHLIGATHEISIRSAAVLRMMTVLPFLMAAREYFWGVLMKRRLTRHIWKGKAISLGGMILVLTVMILIGPRNPAIIGAASAISAEAAEFLFLLFIFLRNRHNLGPAEPATA